MKLLKNKTQRLLAASIAHDGKIVIHARRRTGTSRGMKDLLPAGLSAVARTPTRFTFSLEPGVDALISIELGCWRPYYPFVTSFHVGENSDWPFGAGDLPQVGETAAGVDRHRLEFAFDPRKRRLTWQNTKSVSGQLQLDDTDLVMAYLSVRLFAAARKPQARLEIGGGLKIAGQASFEV